MEVAEKNSKEAIFNHSNSVFIVFVIVLGLYWQFFANCRHPDSSTNVVVFDTTVVLTRHVRSAWALIGKGRRFGLLQWIMSCLKQTPGEQASE